MKRVQSAKSAYRERKIHFWNEKIGCFYAKLNDKYLIFGNHGNTSLSDLHCLHHNIFLVSYDIASTTTSHAKCVNVVPKRANSAACITPKNKYFEN